MTDMDLNLLPVLVALYDERSVTRAARKLGISQPAASVALNKLRSAFGDPLFLKTSVGVQPTSRADALVPIARSILARIESEMTPPSEFEPRTTKRPFTFALSETGECWFLPKIVAHLQKLAPQAPIRSFLRSQSEVEGPMEAGEIDIAIGNLSELQGSAFVSQRLMVSDVVCLVREDHPIRGKRLTLKQYLGLGYVLIRSSGRTNDLLDRSLGSVAAERNIVLIASHSVSLPEVLENTDLAATVNHPLADHFLRMGAKLRTIQMPEEVIPTASINQVWHSRFHQDPRNRWLRSLVKDLFAR